MSYENPKLIALDLLKRYFNDDAEAEVNLTEIQIKINAEESSELKDLLNKLVVIYSEKPVNEGGLSLEDSNDFFLELSISPCFSNYFDAFWEDLFEQLTSFEKRILLDPIPYSPPRYAPVKLTTGRTYDYAVMANFWHGKTRFFDPIDNTLTTGALTPDVDSHVTLREWYEERGLQKAWEAKAINAGSPDWRTIEERYRGGKKFGALVVPQPAAVAPQPASPEQVVTMPRPRLHPVALQPADNPAPVAATLPQLPRVNSALFQQLASQESIIKIVCVGDHNDRKRYIANLSALRSTVGVDFFIHQAYQKIFQIWDNAGYHRSSGALSPQAFSCKNAAAVIIIPKDADELRYYCTDPRYHDGENCQLFFLDIELADQPRTAEEKTALLSMASRFPNLIKLQYQHSSNNLAEFCGAIEAALNNRPRSEGAARHAPSGSMS